LAPACDETLRVLMLVMVSGEDAIVDPHAAEAWARTAPPGRVDFVSFEGFYHEMLNELDNERAFARMDGWLEARLA
jgi:alpha-beta hydrolase superfamily lysophospholipase